jgi:UDP-N-acetylmuramoylalanine--D-glutamate ligase
MEYVGCIQGKHFYNDSIATIPEATLQALEALGDVSTLIIGGYDRGIDYTLLTDYLLSSFKGIVLYTGDAGKRIISQFPINADIHSRLYYFDDFSAMIAMAIKSTPVGGICLLSPAAASYDQFKNFEERGRIYKDLVISLSK